MVQAAQENAQKSQNLLYHISLSCLVLNLLTNCILCFHRSMDAAAAAQQAQIQQQLMALANSPYGDSPLFRNLKQVHQSFKK